MNKVRIKNFFPRIKNFFINEPQIWISFLIPFGLMLIVYLLFGVYPVKYKSGDAVISRSVLSLDLNAQYAYYFAYMKDVFAGRASLLYSWSRNLSGEFIGIIGYYLFSPFNILVWIFPLSHLTEGLLLMIITKLGFVGALMAVYLSKGRKFSRANTITFSIMYAFMSYCIEQTMNPMWLDGVMILPILVMGIEALLREGKYKLMIFSLFYAIVTSFYIGYMICIFTVLYYIYYVFSSRKANGADAATVLKRSGLFALSAIIAALCACFMLMPIYSSLKMGKFDFTKPDYTLTNNFDFLDITRKLFPNSYDTVRMEGLPFLYCGTLTLLLLPAYFLCSRVRRAKRISGAVLIAVLFVCMYIKPVDMIWHGRQFPNWLPYRYSFMLCFLFLVFAAEAFENIREVKGRTIGVTALVLAVILLYLEKSDTFIEALGNNGREVFDRMTVILPALGFIIVVAAFIILAKNKLVKRSFAAGTALITIIGLEMYYNAQWSVYKQHKDIVYSTRDSFNDVILPTREVTDKIQKDDPGFYRVEKLFFRSANDAMALNIKGVTHSSSVLNARAIDLLQRLGYAARSHASRYSGATPLTDDLFGFKYTLSCKDNNTVNIKSAADITVEENPNVMPIAYLTDPDVINVALDKYDVFDNQSRLLSAMLGNPEDKTPDYFVRVKVGDIKTDNLKKDGISDGHEKYVKTETKGKANLHFFLTADKDGDFYMYLPSNYERKCDLYVNDKYMGVYFETDNHYIKKLGTFQAGDEIHVRFELQKENLYYTEAYFMRLNSGLLDADIAKLAEINQNTVFEAKSDTSLKITTSRDKDSVLFASIPKEPGWTIKIDGQKTEYITLVDDKDKEIKGVISAALICVNVPAGQHTITMTFFPNLMLVGISLSFLGISAFILLGSVFYRNKGIFSSVNTDEYDGYDPDYIAVFYEEEEEPEYTKLDFGDVFSVNNRIVREKDDDDYDDYGEDFDDEGDDEDVTDD